MVFGINSKDIVWKSPPEHNIDIPHIKQMAVPLGTRYEDIFGNDYMYVQFAASSLSAGDPVTLFGTGTMPAPADIIPTTATNSGSNINGYAIRNVPEAGMFGLILLERPLKQMDSITVLPAELIPMDASLKTTAETDDDCFLPIGFNVPYIYDYGLIKHSNWASASSSFAGGPVVYAGFQAPLITPGNEPECYYMCQMRVNTHTAISIPKNTFFPCVKIVGVKDTAGNDRTFLGSTMTSDKYCGYARVDSVTGNYTYGIECQDGVFGIYDGDDRSFPKDTFIVIVLDFMEFVFE